FFFSSRRRHTRFSRDWSSDVCSSDLRYVQNWFETNGVEVINEANITKVERSVLYNHDEPIHTDEVVWTAGIKPNQIVRNLEVEKDRQGRVILTKHHNIPNYEHIYVVGDCASLPFAPSAQLA